MSVLSKALINRPSRLRVNSGMRALVAEHQFSKSDLVMPLFVKSGHNICQPIISMPGQFQYSLDQLDKVANRLAEAGIFTVILFGVVNQADKDEQGSVASHDNGLIQQAIKIIKQAVPEILIIADVCFCEYTDHGHCGIIDANYILDNDSTLPHLASQAVSLAKAGADILAPSGMLDGMVATMRHALDAHGMTNKSILSYAVKYASPLYGPFREAADGAPMCKDRKTYQMDTANSEEAVLEASLDIDQGADMLLIKPAYGDIVYRISDKFKQIPVGAYHVSGQYAMIKAASAQGWIDEKQAVSEMMLSMKRAGARFVITYYAEWIANNLL